MVLVHDDDLERILGVGGDRILDQTVSESLGVRFESFVTFILVRGNFSASCEGQPEKVEAWDWGDVL
jgi:hypothetical protein